MLGTGSGIVAAGDRLATLTMNGPFLKLSRRAEVTRFWDLESVRWNAKQDIWL